MTKRVFLDDVSINEYFFNRIFINSTSQITIKNGDGEIDIYPLNDSFFYSSGEIYLGAPLTHVALKHFEDRDRYQIYIYTYDGFVAIWLAKDAAEVLSKKVEELGLSKLH